MSTKIQSINIPNSVKLISGFYDHQISGGPFFNCFNLQEIIIHDESNLTNIGYAFGMYCQFSSFFIPKNLLIQEGAFVLTNKLKSITLHPNNSYYSLYKGILYSKDFNKLILCPNLLDNKVEIHPSCTYIGFEGFRGYDSVYDLVIPETILTFSGRTFLNCHANKIVFEGNRLSFDVERWFYESASEIVFPNNLKIIKSKCFENSHVRKIEMNSKIEIIETDAFLNCIYLEEFKINSLDQVLIVQPRAFNGCPKLVSFVLPAESASLIKFNNSAAFKCARYLEITYIMNLATISDHFLNTSTLKKTKIDIRSIDNTPCGSVGISFKPGECKLNHVCSLENYNSFYIHLFLSLMNINNIHPNVGSLFP